MIDAFPKAKMLLAGRGCDADWFRTALTNREAPALMALAVTISRDKKAYYA